MTDTVTMTGPFSPKAMLDLACYEVLEGRRGILSGIFASRPDGVLMATNPLILPEPRYFGQGDPVRLVQALERFRDEVVCWATPIGNPEERFFTTALSKLYLSWLFGKPSDEISPLAIPFGVTRYAGGISVGKGEMGEGPDRMALAYSGAAEEDDKMISTWVGRALLANAEERRVALRALDEPRVNFLTEATLTRLDDIRKVPEAPSCLEQVRAAAVQLAA